MPVETKRQDPKPQPDLRLEYTAIHNTGSGRRLQAEPTNEERKGFKDNPRILMAMSVRDPGRGRDPKVTMSVNPQEAHDWAHNVMSMAVEQGARTRPGVYYKCTGAITKGNPIQQADHELNLALTEELHKCRAELKAKTAQFDNLVSALADIHCIATGSVQ